MAKNESRHLEEEPKDAQSMVQLVNEFLDLRVTGTPDNNDPSARTLLFRQQPDGTLRAYSLQSFIDADGDERIAVVGPDGQQFMGQWIYDSAGAAWVEMMGEPTGEQRNVIIGADAAGNLDTLRTNADHELIVDVDGSTSRNPIEGIAVPAALADIWTPGGANTYFYDIMIELVPIDVANNATGVTVGVDYGNDGAAIDHYFCRNITVNTSVVGTWIGPRRIWGDDAIMAEATSGANDLEAYIHILREGTI
ncbi:MAG TPA: hypothetical protein VMW58_05130 [Anaerolineae bacterium]|nr:hypothetical protein [Anaerolineae bacterium]